MVLVFWASPSFVQDSRWPPCFLFNFVRSFYAQCQRVPSVRAIAVFVLSMRTHEPILSSGVQFDGVHLHAWHFPRRRVVSSERGTAKDCQRVHRNGLGVLLASARQAYSDVQAKLP